MEVFEVGREGVDMAGPAFFSGLGVVGEGEDVGGLGEGHVWSVGVLGVTCEG